MLASGAREAEVGGGALLVIYGMDHSGRTAQDESATIYMLPWFDGDGLCGNAL